MSKSVNKSREAVQQNEQSAEKRSAAEAGVVDNATPAKKPRKPTPPPLAEVLAEEVCDGDLSVLKGKLLDFSEADKARRDYNQFVEALDFDQDPETVEKVTFGDVLHLVPAIKTNKRKLSQMYSLDAQIRDLYVEAQKAYETVQVKALKYKVKDYGKRLTAKQKKKRQEEKQGNSEAGTSAAHREENDEQKVADEQ